MPLNVVSLTLLPAVGLSIGLVTRNSKGQDEAFAVETQMTW